jgi:hypothetical protein
VKKITPDPPETPSLSTSDPLDPGQLSKVAQHALCDPLRNPKPANPISHIFTIAPDVDTETLWVHASGEASCYVKKRGHTRKGDKKRRPPFLPEKTWSPIFSL